MPEEKTLTLRSEEMPVGLRVIDLLADFFASFAGQKVFSRRAPTASESQAVPERALPPGEVLDAVRADFPRLVGSRQGASRVELDVLDWLRVICGRPETAGVVSGGSVANLNALAAAACGPPHPPKFSMRDPLIARPVE